MDINRWRETHPSTAGAWPLPRGQAERRMKSRSLLSPISSVTPDAQDTAGRVSGQRDSAGLGPRSPPCLSLCLLSIICLPTILFIYHLSSYQPVSFSPPLSICHLSVCLSVCQSIIYLLSVYLSIICLVCTSRKLSCPVSLQGGGDLIIHQLPRPLDPSILFLVPPWIWYRFWFERIKSLE